MDTSEGTTSGIDYHGTAQSSAKSSGTSGEPSLSQADMKNYKYHCAWKQNIEKLFPFFFLVVFCFPLLFVHVRYHF